MTVSSIKICDRALKVDEMCLVPLQSSSSHQKTLSNRSNPRQSQERVLQRQAKKCVSLSRISHRFVRRFVCLKQGVQRRSSNSVKLQLLNSISHLSKRSPVSAPREIRTDDYGHCLAIYCRNRERTREREREREKIEKKTRFAVCAICMLV